MNRKKTYNFLNRKLRLTKSSNGWYRFDDPDTNEHQSMAVNFDLDRVKDFVSGKNTTIFTFLLKYLNLDREEIKSKIDSYEESEYTYHNHIQTLKSNLTLPDNTYSISTPGILRDRAVSYLTNRGFDYDYLVSKGLCYCNKGEWFGRIIIPFKNPGLIYYIARSFVGNSLRYKNPKNDEVGVSKSSLFYNESALNNSRVYLTEGVFDALSCGDLGIASLGWSVSPQQYTKLITSKVSEIYIIPDKGFYKKALLLASKLLRYKKVYICNLDYDDRGDDVNEIGLSKLIFNQVTWRNLKDITLK